ncbi:MAG: PAS domain-containing protein [Alphaproteobacteria bacterium]|nr:PAS domain-containing protein [Alphaproteobacteria bacterium]MBF0130645.1 PAS domain-containing protein [Alphaproteobacteria bacterium]
MNRPPLPLRRLVGRRLVGTAVAVALPAIGGAAILLAFGKVGLAPVLGGVVVAVAAVALLLRPLFADMLAVSAYARELARGTEATPPRLSSWAASAVLSGAIADLGRSWRQRTSEIHSLLTFNDVVLDNLPDPLLLLAGNRRIERANRAARRLFGREIKGLDLATVLRDPEVLEAVEAVLSGRAPAGDVVVSLPSGPSERIFRLRVEALPQPGDPENDRGGEASGTLLALYDVTAILRTEQMRADFVANVSHELRTPLTILSGFIETLEGPARDDTEARERFLGIMHEQTARMTRMVGDLLSLSRIEMNEHTRPSGRVDPGEILHHVVATLELRAKERDVSLSIEIAKDLPHIHGDSDELVQVFTNLLDNAIKYGRPGTSVDIVARREERGPASMPGGSARPVVSVSVRDRGDGIGKDHLPRLTERFYRVDAARSREMGGTGLGLAIVKHVVNRHRGAMSIESEIGRGSTFTVFLPLEDQGG